MSTSGNMRLASLICIAIIIVVAFASAPKSVYSRPTTFFQDFKVTWGDSHVRQLNRGQAVQLLLDQNSGCGFASKKKYLFGQVSMRIKLVPGDSAGTVTAFYNSDTNEVRDELDFEFLGNRTGQPYTVQTNIFARGKGDKEQYYVDDVPVRVFRNNEAKGVGYPKSQPMGVYSTLWEADDWATRGGLEKINWSKAPFVAYYKDFDIEGCPVPGPSTCASNPTNWWEGANYKGLTPLEARKYRWVRMNHMIYDYCTDKSRFPVPPTECTAGF
ncbi:Probable xyloglucan endotransglucosylase/hydrolase protein 6 [Linum perenne]